MIRKSGLLIFLVLLTVLLVLVYFGAGIAIRAGLVFGLEKAAGAEVNVSKVSLSLSPLALEIQGVQITDKHQPELNLLSFERAHADLEVWPALMGYYVIDDFSLNGLKYKSPRKSPGKVYLSKQEDNQENQSAAEKLNDVLKLDIPNAEDLLARLDLQTVVKGEALKAEAQKQKQVLTELESKLPDKQKLLDLQAEIKALTDSKISSPTELAQKAEQLKKLREQVKQESENLKSAREQLSQSRKQLGQAIAEVKEAKNADWEKLQSLANIKDGGLAPISQLLLGDLWGKRIAQLQSFYNVAKPYLPASVLGKNGEVLETEPEKVLVNRILPIPKKPYPNFWIKSAKVDWMFGGGNVDVQIKDITAEHALIGAPTRFKINTNGLPSLESLVMEGDFAVRQQMTSNVSWTLDKLKLEPTALGGSETLRFTDGLVDSTGSFSMVNNKIEQKADVLLNGAKFSTASNKTMDKLVKILNQQASIPLTLMATGEVNSPTVSVRSNLDQIIGDAILAEAKEKIAALESKLKGQFEQKVKQQLDGQNDWLDKLNAQDNQVDQLQSIVEEALKGELQSVKDQAKDKLKDQIPKFGK